MSLSAVPMKRLHNHRAVAFSSVIYERNVSCALARLTPLLACTGYAMEKKSSIIAIGLTIHNTPIEIREKLAIPEVSLLPHSCLGTSSHPQWASQTCMLTFVMSVLTQGLLIVSG